MNVFSQTATPNVLIRKTGPYVYTVNNTASNTAIAFYTIARSNNLCRQICLNKEKEEKNHCKYRNTKTLKQINPVPFFLSGLQRYYPEYRHCETGRQAPFLHIYLLTARRTDYGRLKS